jgi:putative MATE family efflux protein
LGIREENKMGTLPIDRLLVSMSLPMMGSMLILALYNVVDSIFVARLSEAALTAVSLAFPVQMLMSAVGVGTGVGINALLARRLGEKNFSDANLVAANGIFLAVLSSLAFTAFGLLGVEHYFGAFTDPGRLRDMGISYTLIVSVASQGLFLSIAGERVAQATGNTLYSMFAQLAGAVTNIILDPILIFGLLGFPRMEVAGAAIATVIGQFVSMAVIFYFNLARNREVTLSLRGFRPHRRVIGEIYRIGLPSIFMQAIGSVMTLGMNRILILFSQTAVAVFGVYFKLQSFVFMPVFGLNSGMTPIIGYNYGARHRARIVQTVRLAVVVAICIMAAGTLVFQLLPGWILSVLFEASPAMLEIGVPALRIISLHFIPAAVSIVLSGTFQALGQGMYSLAMSASRQLLVLLPGAYLLGRYVSLDAVWLCFPLAETVALVMALLLFRRLYQNRIRHL